MKNLKRVANTGVSITVRIPLIPGFNDSYEEVFAIVDFVVSIGIKSIDILPFHNLGASKYEYLGKKFQLSSVKPLKIRDPKLTELKSIIEQNYKGTKVSIGG